MSRSIELEYVYRHPIERVWAALTDSDALARWLMENDFEPRVGHRFTFRTDPAPGFDGVVHCEVLALDPPHRIEFTWKGGPVDTVVTWTLDEVEGGTRLRVTQIGFRGLRANLVRLMLRAGSRELYGEKLRDLLAGTPDTESDARDVGDAGDGPDTACWTPWGRFLRWLSTRFAD